MVEKVYRGFVVPLESPVGRSTDRYYVERVNENDVYKTSQVMSLTECFSFARKEVGEGVKFEVVPSNRGYVMYTEKVVEEEKVGEHLSRVKNDDLLKHYVDLVTSLTDDPGGVSTEMLEDVQGEILFRMRVPEESEELAEAVKVVMQYTDGAITIKEVVNWIVRRFPKGIA